MHIGARYYDPDVGRFTTADTWLGEPMRPGSLNRYLYCEGDPVNCVDPSGHYGPPEWIGGLLILIGALIAMSNPLIGAIVIVIALFIWIGGSIMHAAHAAEPGIEAAESIRKAREEEYRRLEEAFGEGR